MFDSVPNDSTGYVFAAYIVFLLLLLIYIGILGAKFQRISRDITELTSEVESGRSTAPLEGATQSEAGAKEPTGV